MLLIFRGTVQLYLAKDFVILSTTALISGINLATKVQASDFKMTHTGTETFTSWRLFFCVLDAGN
jgi:hypothetical protein